MASEQLIENVAEGIEEVAEHVEEVAEATRRLTGREVGFFVVGTGIGVAIGFTVGYRLAEKRLQTKYSKIAEQEVADMRDHYNAKVMAAQEKPPVEKVVEKVVEKAVENKVRYSAVEQQAIDEIVEAEEAAAAVENVFEGAEPEVDWDYAVEIKNRQPGVPYIIHRDEFNENENEHEQFSYTYYEVDDVLADGHEKTIMDMDETIGLGNLGHWGHGSGDPNIVYIRNEELQIDYEIIRDRGSYEDEVRRTIRHSHDRRRRVDRKFDDD